MPAFYRNLLKQLYPINIDFQQTSFTDEYDTMNINIKMNRFLLLACIYVFSLKYLLESREHLQKWILSVYIVKKIINA